MKRFIYMTAALLVLLTGCQGQEDPQPQTPAICGEWKSLELPIDAAIYISFSEDGSFELYQHLKADGYELYRGEWTISEGILSGRYNDGENWAYSYQYDITKDSIDGVSCNILKLTGNDGTENRFIACEIPSYIKESSTVVVKSSSLL